MYNVGKSRKCSSKDVGVYFFFFFFPFFGSYRNYPFTGSYPFLSCTVDAVMTLQGRHDIGWWVEHNGLFQRPELTQDTNFLQISVSMATTVNPIAAADAKKSSENLHHLHFPATSVKQALVSLADYSLLQIAMAPSPIYSNTSNFKFWRLSKDAQFSTTKPWPQTTYFTIGHHKVLIMGVFQFKAGIHLSN